MLVPERSSGSVGLRLRVAASQHPVFSLVHSFPLLSSAHLIATIFARIGVFSLFGTNIVTYSRAMVGLSACWSRVVPAHSRVCSGYVPCGTSTATAASVRCLVRCGRHLVSSDPVGCRWVSPRPGPSTLGELGSPPVGRHVPMVLAQCVPCYPPMLNPWAQSTMLWCCPSLASVLGSSVVWSHRATRLLQCL